MQVQINGEARELPEETTLERLVEMLALAPERLAVELNLKVVRRDDWPQARLSEGDRVEIVHFVGGG